MRPRVDQTPARATHARGDEHRREEPEPLGYRLLVDDARVRGAVGRVHPTQQQPEHRCFDAGPVRAPMSVPAVSPVLMASAGSAPDPRGDLPYGVVADRSRMRCALTCAAAASWWRRWCGHSAQRRRDPTDWLQRLELLAVRIRRVGSGLVGRIRGVGLASVEEAE